MKWLFLICGGVLLLGAALAFSFTWHNYSNARFDDEQVKKGADELLAGIMDPWPLRAQKAWRTTRLALVVSCTILTAALGLIVLALGRMWTRRLAWGVAAIATLVVAGGLFGVTSGWGQLGPNDPAEIFIMVPEDRVDLKGRDSKKIEVKTLRVALSPDGKTLALANKVYIDDFPQRPLERDEIVLGTIHDGMRQPLKFAGEPPLRFSPDGMLLASCGRDNIFVTRVEDNSLKFKLEPPSRPDDPGPRLGYSCEDMAFRHDGKMLAAAHGANVRIWELGNGKQIHQVKVDGDPQAAFRAIAFTADGKSLVGAGYHAGSLEFFACVWSLDPLKLKATHKLPGKIDMRRQTSWGYRYRNMVLSKDASTVAWVSGHDQIYVAEVGGQERQLSGSKSQSDKGDIHDDVRGLSPDGKLLLTRPSESPTSFRIWDAAAGKMLWKLKTATVSSGTWDADAEFSPDGKRVVITDLGSKSIRIEHIEMVPMLK